MLYVHPNFQGQAVGRSLLAKLFRVLATKGLDSALIWVLAENPARFFYEAMGGTLIAGREERLWGVPLREMAYGWSDLKTAVNGGVKSVHWGGVKVVHFALAVSLSMESTGGSRARRAAALSCASGAARVGGACGPPWSSG